VPLNYSYCGDAIYFHCALEGHKLENIEANPKVSFCVVGKTEVLPDKFATKYESVIVFGEACEVMGDEKQNGLVELVKKYSSGFMKEGLEYIEKIGGKARVYRITVETITGKARR
jgi:nitroimidazol reductase NimA-like FMN-containing flavoprotein (pyridoxamine 5'-phosphate oxidase superfamily)